MTHPQSFDHETTTAYCRCRECGFKFALPAVALCPFCRSRYIERPDPMQDAITGIRAAIAKLRAIDGEQNALVLDTIKILERVVS